MIGRLSVSTASDMPYKEMASHCEALQKGKQRKMSDFMGSQEIPDNLLSQYCHDFNQATHVPSHSQSGNPFLDQNFSANPATGMTPMLCATEYQHHPDFFMLPAASPFDHFLKASGS
ncbi:unnamed protein product [Camellia sinensis]